jgi:hypothetical protein
MKPARIVPLLAVALVSCGAGSVDTWEDCYLKYVATANVVAAVHAAKQACDSKFGLGVKDRVLRAIGQEEDAHTWRSIAKSEKFTTLSSAEKQMVEDGFFQARIAFGLKPDEVAMAREIWEQETSRQGLR